MSEKMTGIELKNRLKGILLRVLPNGEVEGDSPNAQAIWVTKHVKKSVFRFIVVAFRDDLSCNVYFWANVNSATKSDIYNSLKYTGTLKWKLLKSRLANDKELDKIQEEFQTKLNEVQNPKTVNHVSSDWDYRGV